MTNNITSDIPQSPQSIILSISNGGNILLQQMLAAIKELESKQVSQSVEALNGEWRLLWTSGTKNYQKLNNISLNTPIKSVSSKIIQRFEKSKLIANEVFFPFGSLTVLGEFVYNHNRIQFTFNYVRLKLNSLPIQIPLGWAKGWLQTTYIDEYLHIERGDRGGVSVYIKNTPVQAKYDLE